MTETVDRPVSTPARPAQAPAPVPGSRGWLGDLVLPVLAGAPDDTTDQVLRAVTDQLPSRALRDDDVHLTLWCLYELHYRGLADVDERWEWAPAQLALRHALESRVERVLRRRAASLAADFAATYHASGVAEAFRAVARAVPGAGTSRFVQGSVTAAQWREFLAAKSVYQLKEADPHSWAIPRLSGDAKTALLDIQYDEYGSGHGGRQHSQLFERTLRASGLDPTYGVYVDAVPTSVLALNNLMSMLGLHRRLVGACLGQLALYESTSCLPNKHYAAAARRMGLDEGAVEYFTEHVEVDAIHEQVAVLNLVGSHLRDRPDDAAGVGFGVAAGTLLDDDVATEQQARWRAGECFLRRVVW